MESLENLKHGFKRKKRCNKYRSEITTQLDYSNLGYMLDQKFRKIKRLFVQSVCLKMVAMIIMY